jgi:hypothetical protein
MAVTVDKSHINVLIKHDHQVRTHELCNTVGIRKPAVVSIMHYLGFNKICTSWIPKMLEEEHKEAQKAICTELIQCYNNEGDAFMSCTVTGDKT